MSVSVMKKLTVYAHSSDADTLVKRLMKLRCVDIGKVGISDETDDFGTELYNCESLVFELRKKLERTNEAHMLLSKFSTRKKSLFAPKIEVNKAEFILDGRYERAEKIIADAMSLSSELSEISAEQNKLSGLISSLEVWKGYDMPMNFEGTGKTALMLGSLSYPDSDGKLAKALGEIPAYIEYQHSDKSSSFATVIYPRDCEDEVNRVCSTFGFNKLNFKNIDTTAAVAIAKNESLFMKLDASAIRTEDSMRELAGELDLVEVLYDIDAAALSLAEQKLKLYSAGSCVLLHGWVPVRAEKGVAEVLDGIECAYEIEDAAEGDEPPVLLENNRISSTFEWVVGMYSYPKYGRFDPTFIMSIFYFFIFGLMFADVGYGLVLCLACFGGVKLLKPQENMKRFMLMFGYCGISCIIMGAIFGGWFGDLPFAIMINILGKPDAKQIVPFFNGMWFNPLDDPMMFLIVSLGAGAVHLIAGMAVQFYMLCKDGRVLDAFCDVLPWWVVFGGIGALVLDTSVGLILLGVGVLALILTQGRHEKNIFMKLFKGVGSLYNLINYASDLLSYSRILALGLVAGVIAQVINLITMLGSSVVGFIVMLLVLILGHLLNLAINVLGTFVHTSRLQYIEFFGKFYEDGGREFVAAKSENKYTLDADTDSKN